MNAYQLTSTDAIIRTADGAIIPPDDGNGDYQAYLAWVSDGNEPDAAPDIAPAAPPTLSELQAQLSILSAQIAGMQSGS